MRYIAGLACILCIVPILSGASMPVGTWVRRDTKQGLANTLIIETSGSGWKLTFKIQAANGTSTLVATTQGDGKDAVVSIDGKPSNQTMAIRIVDDRHTINTLKMSGQTMLT